MSGIPNTYSGIRDQASNGDLISISGTSFISLMIRAITFGKLSHTAMLIWIDGGLWVYEIREFVGIRFTPASLYIKDLLDAGKNVYYSPAPDMVSSQPELVYKAAMSTRKATYGYTSLLTVLWSQLRDKPVATDALVCSLLAQRIYEACGVKFKRLASPQLMPDYCQGMRKVTSMGDRDAKNSPLADCLGNDERLRKHLRNKRDHNPYTQVD